MMKKTNQIILFHKLKVVSSIEGTDQLIGTQVYPHTHFMIERQTEALKILQEYKQ